MTTLSGPPPPGWRDPMLGPQPRQPRPQRQDLSKAAGGTITGRGGNVQQLGKAAMRRMPAPAPPPKPAWQQLADQGVAGQGSAAANKAKLAGLGTPVGQSVSVTDDMRAQRVPPGQISRGMAGYIPRPARPLPVPYGEDGMAMPIPGEAPPAEMAGGALPLPGGGIDGGPELPGAGGPLGGGVDSNAFAANGGAPSGAPLQQGQPGGGQGARIAALIARLRGGGAGLQPRMA